MFELPTKAVILAAGLGTRMRSPVDHVALSPEQESIAAAGIKALMPVGRGRIMLQLIIEAITSAGFSQICLVIGPRHDAIRKFCSNNGIDVEFAVQSEPLGTANAVLAAARIVSESDLFLVVNSDNLYTTGSLQRLRASNRPSMLAFDRASLIEKSNITEARIASFAIVEIGEGDTLKRIIEKPEKVDRQARVSMNAWLFSPVIFEACRRIDRSERDEFELTSAVQFAIDELGEKFLAIRTDEYVLDLSSQADIETISERIEQSEK